MHRAYWYLTLFVCLIIIVALIYFSFFTPVTTVILVRHAERLNDSDTTSLSEAGLQRAATLAHVVGASGIDRIFVSEKVRTLQTAAPTAAAIGVAPVQITASETDRWADSVDAHKGEEILIVGHSDTVPKIMDALGVSSPPTIERNEFDDLFVVTIYRFRVTMIRLKYGTPT